MFLGLAFGMALMARFVDHEPDEAAFRGSGAGGVPGHAAGLRRGAVRGPGQIRLGLGLRPVHPAFRRASVMLCSAASLGLCFLPPGIWSMTAFSLSFGGCIGGLWTILPAVVSYFFGNGNFLPVLQVYFHLHHSAQRGLSRHGTFP